MPQSNFLVPAICALACSIALTGCGQKGPLYLPDTSGTVITRPAGATQAPPAADAATAPDANSPPKKK